MITRIKNYWKLRKLRRDALTLLIINGADIAEEVKNLIEFIHVFLDVIHKACKGRKLYRLTRAACVYEIRLAVLKIKIRIPDFLNPLLI